MQPDEILSRRGGLLGLLVRQHRLKPEVVATESLTYLLSSRASRRALDELGQALQPKLTAIDEWRGEVVDPNDRSRVDLAGYIAGKPTWLIEAKFWAPLQPTQPGAYLRRLRERPDGLLLFVVPSVRIRTLWPEVMRRVTRELGVARQDTETLGRGGVAQHLPAGCCIGMVSWDALLSPAIEASTAMTRGRWEQLAELASWQDTEALPPLTEDDLSSATGTQLYKLLGVIDAAATELRAAGWTATTSTGWSHNGFRLQCPDAHPMWFGLWLSEWHHGGHPLWIQSEESRPLAAAEQVREAWAQGMPGGDSLNGKRAPRVPLIILRGAEEHLVLESFLQQIRLAHRLLHPDCAPSDTRDGL